MLVQTRPMPSAHDVKVELARRKLGHYVELTSNIKLHRWQWDLCEILEDLLQGTGKKYLFHGPPQVGKSLPMTKRFPGYALGHKPDWRIIIAAYNARQATLLTSPVRDTMRTAEHLQVFPNTDGQVHEPSGMAEFYTNLRYGRLDGQMSLRAVSIEQGFTGSGADLVLIDDPYRSMKDARSPTINRTTCEFYPESIAPRVGELANVAMMYHRYHEADAAGALLETGKWEEFRFPLICDGLGNDPTTQWRGIGEILSPLRSLEWAQEQEASDPQTFASMMQGRPRPASGRLFEPEWFEIVEKFPRYVRWVRYWDLATSTKAAADFTVGALVGLGPDGLMVIADICRWKREWPATRDGEKNDRGEMVEPGILAVTAADRALLDTLYNPALGEPRPAYHVGVEAQGMQLALVQDLGSNDTFGKIPLWPESASGKGDKKQRASTWAARARNGKVKILRGVWNQPFLNEAKVFDGLGLTHDDQIDAVSGATELLHAKTGSEIKPQSVARPNTVEFFEQLERNARQQRRR